MLKGHSRIELTDVKTREKEVHDDDNMITNALNNMLNSFGLWNATLSDNAFSTSAALWQNLLGGILLFDGEITEDAANTMPPSSVSMIGNGARDVSNSGVVTELGSYNTMESGVQSDGSIKFVYDFSTAQANGTIKSVCLTSKAGGFVGWGNKVSGQRIVNTGVINNGLPYLHYDSAKTMYYNPQNYNSDYVGKSYYISAFTPFFLYASYADDAIYVLSPDCFCLSDSADYWTNGKLKILKYKAGFKSVPITQTRYLDTIEETKELEIPSCDEVSTYMGTSKYMYMCTNGNNTYIALARADTIANNSYFYVIKIDGEFNVTTNKIYNNTGVGIKLDNVGSTNYALGASFSYNSGFIAADTNDYIYVFGADGYIYSISVSDSTQIKKSSISVGTTYNSLHSNGDYIYVCDNNNSSKYYMACYIKYVINTKDMSVSPINIKTTHSHDIGPYNNYIDIIGLKGLKLRAYGAGEYISSDNVELSVAKPVNYLATINNLSEAVTKTSSKTMKITYTITTA